ncbi:hypothetical protein B296_00009968 [Ensete ventricosum]|uniref:Uncharacterized protein n=1 Tax=Ensete ventricosum TaxID=4639 RepID=A0A427BAC2_ENSVE|nr:hypothetical protein B296_00009968 [Ensete ventricosum]
MGLLMMMMIKCGFHLGGLLPSSFILLPRPGGDRRIRPGLARRQLPPPLQEDLLPRGDPPLRRQIRRRHGTAAPGGGLLVVAAAIRSSSCSNDLLMVLVAAKKVKKTLFFSFLTVEGVWPSTTKPSDILSKYVNDTKGKNGCNRNM